MDQVQAPFTDEQVRALTVFQNGGWFHPFTCGRRDQHPDNEGILIASNDGWRCPACDYRQYWAHGFMANAEWVDTMDERARQRWVEFDG